MRQLGARPSELPPVRTDVETPSEIQPHERHDPVDVSEPYPVEVHRIELASLEAVSAGPPPSGNVVAEPKAPWEPTIERSSIAEAPEPIEETVEPSPEPEAEPLLEMQTVPELTSDPVPDMQRFPEVDAEPVSATEPGPELNDEEIATPKAVPEQPVTHMQVPPEVDAEPVAATESDSEFRREAVLTPEAAPEPSARAIVAEIPPEPRGEPPSDPERAAKVTPIPAIEASLRPAAEPVMTLESLPPRIAEVESMQPEVAGGRWAEFQELRRVEPRRSRIGLEPMPVSSLPSRSLLGADREPEHRSWFLTIALPVIAAILAVGALLWSGWLRHRVLRQDAEMTALQEQNRKLADALVGKRVDQKFPSAIDNPEASNANGGVPSPAPGLAVPKQGGSSMRREGVSVPPPTQSPGQGRGTHRAMDTGYHPEIVPPYPTLSQAQSATQGRSSTPGQQQAYPSAANAAAGPVASPAAPARAQSSSAPVQSSTAGTVSASGYGIGSSTASRASGNAVNTSALAQNIEAVEGLQRQSQLPLREFHARDGVQVKVTPGLFVSVRSPDQAHGTYALAVSGGGGTYQLRGYVNGPLTLVDNATHRGYQLVILRIAGQETYGYIRPAR